ncbi:hypothetical protein GTG28_20660 [Vibrio sp. OCN044]|uniref:Uncharacterized protein n=1 Tax=Vibrio tetraodonis subsp. pristinus TaxID=2695891 RepID=A0A6L8M263_9VIBR|nr:hypothetical protein [Vibrio tetraodonis]MYM61616.1 hypothetical protein [Vibrio tetraodonis subsp. pristinus]
MAVTVRKLEEHTKMMDELKELTGEKTASAALIKAGYIALEQTKLAEKRKNELQDLKWEHKKKTRKITAFLEALESLSCENDDDDDWY